jgi:hypothetical protein
VIPLPLVLHGLLLRALERAREEPERGDIPGWVLITVMTAALVTVIWALLEPQIRDLLDGVLDSVTGPGAAAAGG